MAVILEFWGGVVPEKKRGLIPDAIPARRSDR